MSQADSGGDDRLDPSPIPHKLSQIWSIGIYRGESPLRLSPAAEVQNPVLSREDVVDVPAAFVADPFMMVEQDTWYMFFEVMNRETIQGEIGLAVSRDGARWAYQQIVLREPYHLSYPYVFKWEDDYYLIPESYQAGGIQLYEAVDFPTEWSGVGTLVGETLVDPSVVRFDGWWWMFACWENTLRLFSSDHLTTGWREHPQSPLVEVDERIARPGGRITLWDGRLVRFGQDSVPDYGARVRAFNVVELTPTTYREEEADESPILSAGSEEWNSRGMHHVDPHRRPQGGWIACVDGWRWA